MSLSFESVSQTITACFQTCKMYILPFVGLISAFIVALYRKTIAGFVNNVYLKLTKSTPAPTDEESSPAVTTPDVPTPPKKAPTSMVRTFKNFINCFTPKRD